MHELGIVFEIQKRVVAVAQENGLSLRDIAQVVVEVGEASTIVPRYLKECWPAATGGTEMQEAELVVEVLIAKVRCKKCGTVYEPQAQQKMPRVRRMEASWSRGRSLILRRLRCLRGGRVINPAQLIICLLLLRAR
ncbi:MAG: hydrogenase maturation nickel metallochaperone HypA [Eubacteriales bacterium]